MYSRVQIHKKRKKMKNLNVSRVWMKKKIVLSLSNTISVSFTLKINLVSIDSPDCIIHENRNQTFRSLLVYEIWSIESGLYSISFYPTDSILWIHTVDSAYICTLCWNDIQKINEYSSICMNLTAENTLV